LDNKLKAGQIQHALTKQQREEQDVLRVGGGKGKKQRREKVEAPSTFEFSVDITVIKKFGLIQVSPPINIDDLDNKIAEIQKKQAWFNENGEAKLKQQVEELRK
jgi:hypothetical protein